MPTPTASSSAKRAEEAHERLAHVESDVRFMKDSLSDLSKQMGDLTTEIRNQGKPQYAVLIGLITLVVLLLGAYANAPLSDLERHDRTLEGMRLELGERGKWIGSINGTMGRLEDHRDRFKEQIANITGRIEHLDTVLQREMRLLDDRLQGEFRHQWNSLDTRLTKAESDLASRSGHRFNRPDFDKYVAPVLKELREAVANIRAQLGSKDRFTRGDFEAEVVAPMRALEDRLRRIEIASGPPAKPGG